MVGHLVASGISRAVALMVALAGAWRRWAPAVRPTSSGARCDQPVGTTTRARPGTQAQAPAAGDGAAGAFGRATGRILEDDSGKPRYLRYQRDLIAPHCGSSVVEVGAGTGEFAALLDVSGQHVVTDVDPAAVRKLDKRFAEHPRTDAAHLDIAAHVPSRPLADTVIAINVLEHFEDDTTILRSLAELVPPGGTIVLWVPGYPQLYGDFDRKVGHARRYTPATLRAAITRAGLHPELVRPVNLLGGIAWWLAVRRGHASKPNPRLVTAYDKLIVPATRALERIVPAPFGQSILGVARTSQRS
jgi:SAM-dependent methyltransferase